MSETVATVAEQPMDTTTTSEDADPKKDESKQDQNSLTVNVNNCNNHDSSQSEQPQEDPDEQDTASEDDEESPSPSSAPSSLHSRPPKMRIKLSMMRKLPTLANRDPALPSRPRQAESEEEDDEEDEDAVKATVVESDDAGDDHVLATVVVDGDNANNNANNNNTSNTPNTSSNKPPKRRSIHNPSRQIRLPPIASPGLFMVPPSSSSSNNNNTTSSSSLTPKPQPNGLVAPAQVFDHAMEQAGYTLDNRTHRGSSVTRTVDDMFDTNVALALRFPPLIPMEEDKESADLITVAAEDAMDVDPPKSLRRQLVDALTNNYKTTAAAATAITTTSAPPASLDGNSSKHKTTMTRKRKQPCRITDMIPVSLTIEYPRDYIEKQLQYVHDVKARERAIIEHQDVAFALEVAKSEEEDTATAQTTMPVKLPTIPPIPTPPSPPAFQDVQNILHAELYDDTPNTNHTYLPKNKSDFTSHLDPHCFHLIHGRYFGLASNFIADPHFVGPNAPGITGINTSGSGLATSSSGGGISGAMALTLSTTYNGTTAGSAAALRSAIVVGGASSSGNGNATVVTSSSTANTTAMATLGTKSASPTTTSNATYSTTPSTAPAAFSKDPAKAESSSSPPSADTQKYMGPRPTATFSDLKKVFDDHTHTDGPLGQSMKECIIKAAVHACRSGRHGISWLAPNGEIYPDVSKAFATYAGIKPCQRCKSNKQGAYHCRLRRKHKDVDYDGGDSSSALLTPLFDAPMESLIRMAS